MASTRQITVAARRNRSASRLAIAFCVCVLALLCGGADAAPSSSLRRESDASVAETVARVDTTAGPTAARDANASHVITDETGDVWHVLDGSHDEEKETTPAVVATTSPPPATTSPPSASVELQEKLDQKTTSNASTASSTEKASTTQHHKTPMMGFVIIGAMAIVCVGVAAGVAKRKRDRANGEGGSHH